MNHSGDAAEQVVRLSIDGMEFVLRITGAAAKNIAAFIIAALKSDGGDGTKLRGRERLTNMLKSGKETRIFTIKQFELKQFATEARRYGVVYTVLFDKKAGSNGDVDIMVKADDASKLNRIMERLEFSAVECGEISVEPAPEHEIEHRDRDDTDKMLDMLIDKDGKVKEDSPELKKAIEQGMTNFEPKPPEASKNPTWAERKSGSPSAIGSATQLSYGDNSIAATKRPSVKKKLDERIAIHKKREEEKRSAPESPTKPKSQQKTTTHTQLPVSGRKKSKAKEL